MGRKVRFISKAIGKDEVVVRKCIVLVSESTNTPIMTVLDILFRHYSKDLVPNSFGIFIHCGIYSIPSFNPPRASSKKETYNGSEWYLGRLKNTFLYGKKTLEYHQKTYGTKISPTERYYEFLPEFEKNMESWSPSEWARLFHSVGAQYVIFTAKHHDGVSLYPSKFGMYHTKRDYVGELKKELNRYGIRLGLYYSLMEWTSLYSKGVKKLAGYVQNVLHPQLKELVDTYHPDILWADGDWHNTCEQWGSEKFLSWLFKTHPSIVINDRWGKDFSTALYEKYKTSCYVTGKDRLMEPPKGIHLWEHVDTISNSWGYAHNQAPSDYKSSEQLKRLYDIVHKRGGRFTINLGPKSNGSFDDKELKPLIEWKK